MAIKQIEEPEQLRKVDNGLDIRNDETPSQWIRRVRRELKKSSKE